MQLTCHSFYQILLTYFTEFGQQQCFTNGTTLKARRSLKQLGLRLHHHGLLYLLWRRRVFEYFTGGEKTVQWHKKEKKPFKFNDFILWMSKPSDQQTNTAISRTTSLLWSANSLYVCIQHATSMSCLKIWLVTALPQLPVISALSFTETFPPLWVVATPDYPVAAGQKVSLYCSSSIISVTGTWSWVRLRNQTWEKEGNSRELILTKPEQSGEYRCCSSVVNCANQTHTVYIISTQTTGWLCVCSHPKLTKIRMIESAYLKNKK